MMLENLFSSKARAELLRIYFGIHNKEMHLRRVQRETGLAIETIRREAMNLEKIHLLLKRKDGNRTYYSANKSHLLYSELHGIVLKTAGLRDVIAEAILSDKIRIAFIFGSIAKGNENENSDIDLFIIGKCSLREVISLLKNPSLMLQREINPHTMTIEEFNDRLQKKDHFICSLIEAPKIFIKGSENELGRLVE